MPEIIVTNIQKARRVNVAALQEAAKESLRQVLKIKANELTPLLQLDEISVLLMSDRRIAQIHRQFMNEAGPTDVITFDHGEIFVSVDTAQENSRRFATSLQREIQLYIIHGLLHLHGFDDRKPAGARKMERTQQKILDSLN